MLLLLDVLFDDRERRTAHGSDEIAMGPKRWQTASEPPEFLPEHPGGIPLHQPDEAMDAKLRINLYEQVYVVWHDFQLENFGASFIGHLLKNCLQADPVIRF
jgi:hypothetical protein